MFTTARARQVVLVVMLLAVAGGAPAWAQPASLDTVSLASSSLASPTPGASAFTPRLDFGFVDLGLSVAPRRPGAALPGARETTTSLHRLADAEIVTTDIGLDVRLRWPAATAAAEPSLLQPYLSLGPALAVPVGEDGLAIGRHALPEPSTSLGMRGALGLTWQLSTAAAVFGEYRLVPDRAGSRPPGDADFFYGLNLRF